MHVSCATGPPRASLGRVEAFLDPADQCLIVVAGSAEAGYRRVQTVKVAGVQIWAARYRNCSTSARHTCSMLRYPVGEVALTQGYLASLTMGTGAMGASGVAATHRGRRAWLWGVFWVVCHRRGVA